MYHLLKIEDCPLNLQPGMHVNVMWAKETVKKGTILELGSERGLKLLRVDATGSPTSGAGIPCRRECELRQKVSYRREVVQAEADQNLYETVETSSSLIGTTLATRMPPFSRAELLEQITALPAVPSPEQVQGILERLPCFAASSTADIRLVVGIDVFINTNILATIHRVHMHRPGTYMSLVLRELVPENVMCLPYISAKGKGPTKVGLPKDLFKAITVYINHRTKYQPINGWANSINCVFNNVRLATAARKKLHPHLSAPEVGPSAAASNNGENIEASLA
ncbi:50S ribosomal protein L1 [Frankliniella fusca]|uniref:50S ribosomal protein L1 n=1 Tax=Frankliniella fusca TaxID=407009 RepID=A0AAE1GYY4_9NEOP|nr:50S ribosomal protein L1 [Frankliniella fusca]